MSRAAVDAGERGACLAALQGAAARHADHHHHDDRAAADGVDAAAGAADRRRGGSQARNLIASGRQILIAIMQRDIIATAHQISIADRIADGNHPSPTTPR